MASSLSPTPLEHKKNFITSLINFKGHEDTYFISELKSSEQKALQDLKHNLKITASESCSMWGVPLLGGDERADVILLKFLRARDFKVGEALKMLEKCLKWRKEFKTEELLETEELGFEDLEGKVVYMQGYDKEMHPVCYNAYGLFKEREIYERVFGDEEKLNKFLRWRIQVLEKGVKMLNFKPGGVNSMIQVTDLKDMPKRELRFVSKQILSLFQDNYPEMVATKIFINVPWYFSAIYSMMSPFLTHRTKSKFVMSKEGNAAETLYRFIKPEDIPVQYGGLSRRNDSQNGPPKPVSEFSIKGGEKVNIQIEGIEGGATITWEIVVGGWELEYSAEFVPNDEQSYGIVVEKPKKIINSFDESLRNSFTTREAGKLIISVDNTFSRKKKVAAYRYSVRKSSSSTTTTLV